MKTYKILHKPTGLYYTPDKGSGNLSSTGKIYNRKPNLSEGYYSSLTIKIYSSKKTVSSLPKKAKLLAEHFNILPKNGCFFTRRSIKIKKEELEILSYDSEPIVAGFKFGFDRYLIMVGIRSLEYTYEDDVIFANIKYFKKCFDANLSAYKALLFLHDYIDGNYDI